MSPQWRLRMAWGLLISTLIGWPLSLVFTDEPPFILSLSWFAVTYTAWNDILTAEVRVKQEEDEDAG